jgi:hypothetical protein
VIKVTGNDTIVQCYPEDCIITCCSYGKGSTKKGGEVMLRKCLIIASVILLLSSSISHSAVFGQILKTLAVEASKGAAGKVGESAVEYFKKIFNKDKTLAQEKGSPQLQDGEVRGKVRKWVISPAGKLSKSEIDDIAKTLKALDQNRDQIISTQINNTVEEISNTQVDNERGVLINKVDGQVTTNQTTIGDISNNTNAQVNINSPNATQNINQKRAIHRQVRFEHSMDADIHILNVIMTQTKGIWDPGEKFQVDIQLSGPFIDYGFVSGLPAALSEVRMNTDIEKGFIHYETRTALINEPVIIRIRSKTPLTVKQISVSPFSEE